MDDENQHNEAQPTMAIFDELLQRFAVIKNQSGKLIDDRLKEKGQAIFFETTALDFKKLGFQ